MSPSMKVALIEIGFGNIRSIYKCLEAAGAEPSLASRPADILAADKLVLPGVGHFGNAISRLESLGLLDALDEAVLVRKTPALGICLGMQLMACRSEEGNAAGLGWVEADVVRFRVTDTIRHKIPHTGWNTLKVVSPSILLRGSDPCSEYYFAHSYHFQPGRSELYPAFSDYGYSFPSVLEHEHLFGTQFHPEKSREAGLTVFNNFLRL